MDAGGGGGKFQIHCPFLPRVLELMLSWSGQHSRPLFSEAFKGHRAGRSAFFEPGFGAVPSQGPSFPLQSLERLSFLALEESGETQWGQRPRSVFSQLSHGLLETQLSPNSEKGKKLNPEAGVGVVRNVGRQRERCE